VWSSGAKLAQRLVLRTARGPLRPVWLGAFERLIRLVSREVTAGEPDVSVYVRGGFGTGDVVPGLSDVDLVVVVAEDPAGPRVAHDRVRARYDRLRARVPLAGRIVGHFFVFEERDLAAAAGTTALTVGLDEEGEPASDRAAYFGPAPVADEIGLLERPGLYGSTADWRLVQGRDRRPPARPRSEQDERIAAWLELQSWWRWAFDAVLAPDRPHVAYLCLKLVAEPCRIWLWLARRERYDHRRDALLRAAELVPAEAGTIRFALGLGDALPHSPRPPLRESLAALTRLSTLVVAELAEQTRPAGTDEVRLVGHRPLAGPVTARSDPGLLPLADWRACVLPRLLDETFRVADGEPSDPAAMHAAARHAATYDALRSGDLLVLPTASLWQRGLLRAVQCPLTDPVSFALADGAAIARFPRVAGWSIEDLARRAVTEHRAWLHGGGSAHRSVRLWLDGPPRRGEQPARTIALLLSAARAALLLESARHGRATLAVTAGGIAELLAGRGEAAAVIAREALDAYRAAVRDGLRPPLAVVERLEALVAALPPLARPSGVAA
jgi:predicted nucleotidyltransferase